MAATRKPRKLKSALPPPIPGEPFSLIGTLRRCTKLITVEDAAVLLDCTRQQVYELGKEGKLPVVDFGSRSFRVDPRAWALLLEKSNPHLMPSVREHLKVARAPRPADHAA